MPNTPRDPGDKAHKPHQSAGRHAERSPLRHPAAAERPGDEQPEEPFSRRPMKEYRDFIDAITDLKLDHDTASGMLSVTLTIVARAMTEDEAQAITRNLPAPLDFEELREKLFPQRHGAMDRTDDIAAEFNLDHSRAAAAIGAILKTLKGCLPEEQHRLISARLPKEWRGKFDGA
jgi:uncharacterized protein (DUF2267 family)